MLGFGACALARSGDIPVAVALKGPETRVVQDVCKGRRPSVVACQAPLCRQGDRNVVPPCQGRRYFNPLKYEIRSESSWLVKACSNPAGMREMAEVSMA